MYAQDFNLQENLNKMKMLKPKFRNVLEMALEEGVRHGWNRAHKHTPDPHVDAATDVIVTEIFNALDEWFEFDETSD